MGYFLVRYDSRVVIYERKMFIRLATAVQCQLYVLLQDNVNNFFERLLLHRLKVSLF